MFKAFFTYIFSSDHPNSLELVEKGIYSFSTGYGRELKFIKFSKLSI